MANCPFHIRSLHRQAIFGATLVAQYSPVPILVCASPENRKIGFHPSRLPTPRREFCMNNINIAHIGLIRILEPSQNFNLNSFKVGFAQVLAAFAHQG
ncbi:uncharacterized protein VTP21DRAFT_840 [Calcarisporiella thermophila]|uniref:uncharacterized protein n=1 Tax=Calcarisporiella thermophila TaxID=911321 RepID=UPI0037440DF5